MLVHLAEVETLTIIMEIGTKIKIEECIKVRGEDLLSLKKRKRGIMEIIGKLRSHTEKDSSY